MMNTTGITVMIADDHKMVRIGLRITIDKSPGLSVVAEAANGREAVNLYRQHQPDVVLMDLVMPEMDGIQATKHILAYDPHARVVALTSYDDITRIHAAVEAGIISYLFKDISIKKLAAAIRDAYDGDSTLIQKATQALMQAARANPLPGHDLTGAELRVLRLVTRGLGNAEIAQKLFVSKSTIKKHVSHILTKMDVSNRAEAAVLAVRHSIVDLDGDD
jgi:two-component system, NarL family, response regulator LiaR